MRPPGPQVGVMSRQRVTEHEDQGPACIGLMPTRGRMPKGHTGPTAGTLIPGGLGRRPRRFVTGTLHEEGRPRFESWLC